MALPLSGQAPPETGKVRPVAVGGAHLSRGKPTREPTFLPPHHHAGTSQRLPLPLPLPLLRPSLLPQPFPCPTT